MQNTALHTISTLHAGSLAEDANDHLKALVSAVESTGKAGTITITLSVRKATAGALAVKGKVTAKMPKEQDLEALLFPTPEGNLLTEDPRQQKLDIRPIAAPVREFRTINQN